MDPTEKTVWTFEGYPKISRYSRECIITEKLDGTNGQILVVPVSEPDLLLVPSFALVVSTHYGLAAVAAGSRGRWLTPQGDNHGFAKWALANAAELAEGLGPGRHFGEWWGNGIQRGYGLKKDDKRFSLFNVIRWDRSMFGQFKVAPAARINSELADRGKPTNPLPEYVAPPVIVGVVPVIDVGYFDATSWDSETGEHQTLATLALRTLETQGSLASPGFKNPEGIAIYHVPSGNLYKKTIGDDGSKGA